MTMRKMNLLLLLLLLASLLPLSACPDKKSDLETARLELEQRVYAYFDCFFWRDFEKAATFVVPEKRAEFRAMTEPMRHGFTQERALITELRVGPELDEAVVVVNRDCVRSPSVTLQTETLKQKWVQRNGSWLLAGAPY